MEALIARWIKETRQEYEKAKKNQNAFQMIQMQILEEAQREMRDKLTTYE